MARYFAFMRGINVGGIRTAKMETLRNVFESLSFTNVDSYIASGNVIFESPEEDLGVLETKIEIGLYEMLGFDVPAHVRTWDVLADIARFEPFTPKQIEGSAEFNVLFMRAPLDKTTSNALLAVQSETDAFHLRGPHVYWLRWRRPGRSDLVSAPVDKVLGLSITSRSMSTIRKLVEKYA